VIGALAVVGIFMVFEVWDLDGSDLYRRLFQPSLVAQSALADVERNIRLGALGVRETLSRIRVAVVSQEHLLFPPGWSQAGTPVRGKRVTGTPRRTDRARATCRLSASLDDPSRLSDRTF
jgi:hypothetical protein